MTVGDIGLLGIVGGGTMGAGIAQVAARSGLDVVLVEQTTERAEAARTRVAVSLEKLVSRGKLSAHERDEALSRLVATTRYGDLAQAEVVIEAVFEELAAKQEVARALGEVLSGTAIYASNTSSISIDLMAESFPRPGGVVGIHFFNPVPALPLVEIVEGRRTTPETLERAEQLARQLGKSPIRVKDRPGFVVNRLLIPMINEAALLAGEGVAEAEAIDTAMRLGASHPMGPLALADLIGLDVCLAIMETLAAELDAGRFVPAPMLRELVGQGRLGRKSGRGFFTYER